MKKIRKDEVDITKYTPSPGRKATKFEGVYFRWGSIGARARTRRSSTSSTRPGTDRQIEAKVGGQFSDEMTESRAAGLRELYLKGHPTRRRSATPRRRRRRMRRMRRRAG